MVKKERQDKIIELINRKEIETQEELAELLNNSGYSITQATVSRDIRELNLTKVAAQNGKQKYALLKEQETAQFEKKYNRILKDGFISMDSAENILVIKTVSGMAMAVAAVLDSIEMNEVVGCIAGDDTIMVAIRTKKDVINVMEYIRMIIN